MSHFSLLSAQARTIFIENIIIGNYLCSKLYVTVTGVLLLVYNYTASKAT